jgi:hypothetical protein
MIPSLKKQRTQTTSTRDRFLQELTALELTTPTRTTIPSLFKIPRNRSIWASNPRRGVLQQAPPVVAIVPRDIDRKLDPAPRGKSWYGNYTGPGNERSDWEDDHLDPQSPLDRGPMQHDQEYSSLEEQYGYGEYKTDSDGKRRFKSDQGSFITMRFDTDNEHLHVGLIESDARLMWRSVWYIGKGIGDGDYDLTFSKGPTGVRTLVTDVLVAGVILTVFPLLIAIDVAFLGVTVGRHFLEGVADSASKLGRDLLDTQRPGDWGRPIDLSKEMQAITGFKPFPHATMGSMWMDVGGYRIGGKGYLFGDKRFPYEIGMRNTTLADIVVMAAFTMGGPQMGLTLAYAGYKALEFGVEKLVHELTAGNYDSKISIDAVAGGAVYYGRQFGSGAAFYGGQISGCAHYYTDRISGGAQYYGGHISRGAKSAGKRLSDWSRKTVASFSNGIKGAGGRISDAWKDTGSALSKGWKNATGGGGGGGCFVTTACAKSLAENDADFVLNVLRLFRDLILLSTEEGTTLVEDYYFVAPQIVQRINASSDSEQEYRRVYRNIVLPTFNCIVEGSYPTAIRLYRDGIRALSAKWRPVY